MYKSKYILKYVQNQKANIPTSVTATVDQVKLVALQALPLPATYPLLLQVVFVWELQPQFELQYPLLLQVVFTCELHEQSELQYPLLLQVVFVCELHEQFELQYPLLLQIVFVCVLHEQLELQYPLDEQEV